MERTQDPGGYNASESFRIVNAASSETSLVLTGSGKGNVGNQAHIMYSFVHTIAKTGIQEHADSRLDDLEIGYGERQRLIGGVLWVHGFCIDLEEGEDGLWETGFQEMAPVLI